MDWQTAAVGAAVVLSALFIGRKTWKTWVGGKSGGCGNCECGGDDDPAGRSEKHNDAIPLQQIDSANHSRDR